MQVSLLCKIGRCVDWVLVRGRWTLVFESFCEMRDNIANRVVILTIPGNPGNDGLYADLGSEALEVSVIES